MHKASWNAFLLTLEPGQREYIETSLDDYPRLMRAAVTPRSRRPVELAGREFGAQLYTAVGFKAGDIRYLVCIERTA